MGLYSVTENAHGNLGRALEDQDKHADGAELAESAVRVNGIVAAMEKVPPCPPPLAPRFRPISHFTLDSESGVPQRPTPAIATGRMTGFSPKPAGPVSTERTVFHLHPGSVWFCSGGNEREQWPAVGSL